MIRTLLLSAAISLMAAPAVLAQSAPQATQVSTGTPIEGIAAIVNDKPISFTDVRQRARLLMMGMTQQPTQEMIQRLTGQALEQLIDEKLQLQKAGEFEVEIEETEIANSVSGIAQQSGITREEMYSQLLQAGVNPVSLEDQMRAEMAWRRIMSGLYGSRIRISQYQIDEQERRLQREANETQYQIAEIFLYSVDPAERAEAMQAAQTVVQQLREGAPFQLAAQRFSSAPTAATGGDKGWISLDSLDQPLATAISAMTRPGITDPIEVDNGVYILALRSKREPQEQVSMVNLRQLVASNGDAATLSGALSRISDCDGIDEIADADGNLVAVTLGEIAERDLNPEMRARVTGTENGGASDVFTSSGGPAALFVCDRNMAGGELPTREQIEDRLYARELGMVSDRELRNLKREATIIRR